MPSEPSLQVAALVAELAQFHGHRTLWLDPSGSLCHSEPDDELEAVGYRYLATLMWPDADTVAALLQRPLAVECRSPTPAGFSHRLAVA